MDNLEDLYAEEITYVKAQYHRFTMLVSSWYSMYVVKRINWNYPKVLVVYLLGVSLFGAFLLMAIDGLTFTQGWFQTVSAITGTGLSTVSMLQLSTPGFVVMWFMLAMGNSSFLLIWPIVYRRYAYRKLRRETRTTDQKVALYHEFLYGCMGVVMWSTTVYFVLWHLISSIVLMIFLDMRPMEPEIKERGFSQFWNALFAITSALANAGFTLSSTNVYYLKNNPLAYMTIAIAVIGGNTGIPYFSRWFLEICVFVAKRCGYPHWTYMQFVLDAPRKVSGHIYSRRETNFLAVINTSLYMIQYFCYLASSMDRPSMLAYGDRTTIAGMGFFQTISTRCGGFQIFNLHALSQGMLVVYAIFMYLATAPFIRTTYLKENMITNPDLDLDDVLESGSDEGGEGGVGRYGSRDGSDAGSVDSGKGGMLEMITRGKGNASPGPGLPLNSVHDEIPSETELISQMKRRRRSHSQAAAGASAGLDWGSGTYDSVATSDKTGNRDRSDSVDSQEARRRAAESALASASAIAAATDASPMQSRRASVSSATLQQQQQLQDAEQQAQATSAFNQDDLEMFEEIKISVKTPFYFKYLIGDDDTYANSFFNTFVFRHSFFLMLAVVIIAFTDDDKLSGDPQYVNLWYVLFELIGAYGNVGVSMGYPGVTYSMLGVFSSYAQYCAMFIMMLGKCRCMPSDDDDIVDFKFPDLREVSTFIVDQVDSDGNVIHSAPHGDAGGVFNPMMGGGGGSASASASGKKSAQGSEKFLTGNKRRDERVAGYIKMIHKANPKNLISAVKRRLSVSSTGSSVEGKRMQGSHNYDSVGASQQQDDDEGNAVNPLHRPSTSSTTAASASASATAMSNEV